MCITLHVPPAGNPEHHAVRADEARLHVVIAALTDGRFEGRVRVGAVVGMHPGQEGLDRPSGQFLPRPAEQAEGCLVPLYLTLGDVQEPGAHTTPCKRRLEASLRHVHLVFSLFALGDIDHCGEDTCALSHLDRGETHLNRECATILMPAGEITSHPHATCHGL